jgi:hypothetical protein
VTTRKGCGYPHPNETERVRGERTLFPHPFFGHLDSEGCGYPHPMTRALENNHPERPRDDRNLGSAPDPD